MFFLLNLLLFIMNIILISLRFHYHPEAFKASFLHPTERLFVPSAAVSLGTVLINISQYGLPHTGPWLSIALLVTFWINVVIAILCSSGIYLLM
jgi:tellurite resistance protein TehA-like permease